MSPHRSPSLRSLLLACAFVSALSSAGELPPQSACAQSVRGAPLSEVLPFPTALATTPSKSSVSLETTAMAAPTNGAFAYDAVVSLAEPAPFLQVRLRIRRPSGRLLFQKTYVRSNVPAGNQVFTFGRAIGDLELNPGLYPVELTVKSEDNPPDSWTIPGVLRVYDPAAEPLRLAVVVKVSSAPGIDPEGRFVVDPGIETRARDEVVDLATAILREPRLRASLAISPELLEEWKRVSTGYVYAGPAGLETVRADSSVPRAYAAALSRLRAAVSTRRLELMNVPYADPDVAGLASIRRLEDLGAHYERGLSAYFASLELTPSAGSFTARGCLTLPAAEQAATHAVTYSLVSPRYVRSTEGTVGGGVYSSRKMPLTALVLDAALSAAFGAASSPSDTSTAEALFNRAIDASEETATALPVLIDVGPGRASTVRGFVERASTVIGQPWVAFVTAERAASNPRQGEVTLAQRASVLRRTPSGWWSSIAASRRYAEALAAVLEPNDRDAEAAVVNSLIAESASWAGPDGRWALVDRGRSFSAAALRQSQAVLRSVRVAASNLTLSGARGSVPFSITNSSGRSLSVVLRVTSDNIAVGVPPLRTQVLRPAENYVTVPVDLRSSVGGSLRLQVVAGTLVIASESVEVRASYLDRLAIVGAIALLLGFMLFYIRRRVRRAEGSADSE